jgi:speckle-type POZ protein
VTEVGTHDFKVNNYPLLEGLGVGKYITSSTFRVGGYDWNIRFYPDGPSKDSDHVLAFLFYLSSAKDVRANITLSTMLEKEDQVQVNNTADDVRECIFSPQSNYSGVRVDKSKLRSESHLDNNGNLTIRCVLAVIKEPPTDHCKRNPVVLPPPEMPGHLERALKNGRGADVKILVSGRESAHIGSC